MLKQKPPKVSILIPCYNQENFITECIDSILVQDFKDYELVISDDGSSDSTPKLLYEYKDERIKIILNGRNRGMVNNWNYILSEAQGEYIKFVFGDDKLTSQDTITEMVRALDAEPEIGLVFCQRILIDSNSLIKKIAETFSRGGTYIGQDIISQCLSSQKNLVGEPTAVMFRRGLAPRGFDTRLKQLVDLEMWMHITLNTKAFFIKKPLVAFRIHEKQQTKVNLGVKDLSEREMLLLINCYNSGETYQSAKILAAFRHCLRKKGSDLYQELADHLRSKTLAFKVKIAIAQVERSILRPFQNLKRTLQRSIQRFRNN
jgi:glycosyltransferase involved in cell wall biosynthesis